MDEYKEPFRYSAEWYATVYHPLKPLEMCVDPGPGQYVERDTKCIEAMGIVDEDSILVPGCGGGHNISLLQSKYKHLQIVGFDWSDRTIDFCRKTFPDVTFRQLDVQSMQFDKSFDHIVAFDFTEHLSLMDYSTFLGKANQSLKPGGTIGVLPGMTIRPEHINLIYPMTVGHHLHQFGFEIITVGKQWVVGRKP